MLAVQLLQTPFETPFKQENTKYVFCHYILPNNLRRLEIKSLDLQNHTFKVREFKR